jgi:homocysteine S-methyltransferase
MQTPFLDAIAQGGMVGDGAMGSRLYERGVFINRNFDEVNLSQPELVHQVHREYLLSGAHVLETNTYGANRLRLARHGLDADAARINEAALDIARRVAEGQAYVAGCMGPTGLSPAEVSMRREAVRGAYAEQAQLLGAADVLYIETIAWPEELLLAIEGVRSVSALPLVAQFTVADTGDIQGGADPLLLGQQMLERGAQVIGVNCNGPSVIFDAVQKLLPLGAPVCAYPNAGRPQRIEDRLIHLATPENFGVFARRMFKAGVHLVGGCCGTSPDFIRRVAAAARMVVPRTLQIEPSADSPRQAPPPLPSRSALGAALGERFLVSVEVNPAPGLDPAPQVAAARMLLEAGADAINIADGPRATVRMSNLALALRMQEALRAQVLLHVCCRDRNLLGLQAFILGAHVLGIRNLVVITGDPPKVGDYPDATAVYDLDSIGLLQVVDGYNHGVDPAGKTMPQTSFVLATGAEPGAADFEREMLRLRQKVDAGANLIMTQPIYVPATLDRFLERTQALDVPVLVGILPLASSRNAEFIHNHIPGMAIPESVRARQRRAAPGPKAERQGVAIAVESLLAVRDKVAGAYIMPPLGRYAMAAEIIAALGNDRRVSQGVPGARCA